MANWCLSEYVIEGDAKELKNLYDLMSGLQERKEPTIRNGFGTAWLGCLVDALGRSWEEVSCRGSWYNLDFDGNALSFNTETAWSPCGEVLDLVCEKYPTLRYYYRSEEPGNALYCTNDREGRYFTDRFYVDVRTPDEECCSEYFSDLHIAFEWLEGILDARIQSRQDIDAMIAQWQKDGADAYCYINEFQILN